jgi:hypothetical protein
MSVNVFAFLTKRDNGLTVKTSSRVGLDAHTNLPTRARWSEQKRMRPPSKGNQTGSGQPTRIIRVGFFVFCEKGETKGLPAAKAIPVGDGPSRVPGRGHATARCQLGPYCFSIRFYKGSCIVPFAPEEQKGQVLKVKAYFTGFDSIVMSVRKGRAVP